MLMKDSADPVNPRRHEASIWISHSTEWKFNSFSEVDRQETVDVGHTNDCH